MMVDSRGVPETSSRPRRRKIVTACAALVLCGVLLVLSDTPAALIESVWTSSRPIRQYHQPTDPSASRVHCLCSAIGCVPLMENVLTRVYKNAKLVVYLRHHNTAEVFEYLFWKCADAGTTHIVNSYWDWPWGKGIRFPVEFIAAQDLVERALQDAGGEPTDNIEWYVPRDFYSPYHILLDRGSYQLAGQLNLARAVIANAQPLPNHTNSRAVTSVGVSLFADIAGNVERNLSVAVYEIFFTMAGIQRLTQNPTDALQPARWQGFGFFAGGGVDWSYTHKNTKHSWPLLQAVINTTNQRLEAKYGPPPAPLDDVIFDERKTSEYGEFRRSRGIHPELLEQLHHMVTIDLGRPWVKMTFSDRMTLEEQFNTVRRHRLFIVGEGAVTVNMMFSRPNTTWVVVYNHTRTRGEWTHASFHALQALSWPHVRLVLFTVWRSHVPLMSDLLAVLQRPWQPGVTFLGSDDDGQPLQGWMSELRPGGKE
jgi:hypothetical protein